MPHRLPTLFLSLLMTLPVAAQAFEARNEVAVTAAPGGFMVDNDGESGASGMWCAAADYASEVLGLPASDRLYIAQGREPGLGQRDPVLFTTDPAGVSSAPVLIVGASLRRGGASLSIGHALQFCMGPGRSR